MCEVNCKVSLCHKDIGSPQIKPPDVILSAEVPEGYSNLITSNQRQGSREWTMDSGQ
jgi:hypothetical protein